MDIVAKTIPAQRRGLYFGARLFMGGVLSVAGSLVVRWALNEQLGRNLSSQRRPLMAIASAFAAAGLWRFTFVIEPPGEAETGVSSLGAHLDHAANVMHRDRNFGLFLTARVALMLAQMRNAVLCRTLARVGRGRGMIGVYLPPARLPPCSLTWRGVGFRIGAAIARSFGWQPAWAWR